MVTGWLPEQTGAAREAVRRAREEAGPDGPDGPVDGDAEADGP